MSTAEVLEHLARRIHVLKMCRAPFEVCPDWECEENRAAMARLMGDRERAGVA
jgi:hypothetical protein